MHKIAITAMRNFMPHSSLLFFRNFYKKKYAP